MANDAENIIQKLWNYCNILRDDGLSYGDYVEQLTYLLFLKMAEEHSKPPFLHLDPIPSGYDWETLASARGEMQLELYERILRRLGQRSDLLGTIYKNALSKFRDPAKFQKLVAEIAAVEWAKFDTDVKGEAYEGLLERTAADGKAGAGQYFTPRALVDAIVEVVRPEPGESVIDPACGTGGFLLSAHRFMQRTKRAAARPSLQQPSELFGVEISDSVARLCLMNLVLHGIGGQKNPVAIRDALEKRPGQRYQVVLANPPFGRRSSYTIVNRAGEQIRESITIEREDFWATTSNKQLNFIQHIFSLLVEDGRAAVIVPDNVLFEGGAGEVIRRELLNRADVHTLLRLPTGIFYAQGIKSNVIFFDRKAERSEPWTEHLWIYDLRTSARYTLKERALRRTDLESFVQAFAPGRRKQRVENDRFKRFTYDEILARDRVSLDISWAIDASFDEQLRSSHELATDIVDDIEAALSYFREMALDVQGQE